MPDYLRFGATVVLVRDQQLRNLLGVYDFDNLGAYVCHIPPGKVSSIASACEYAVAEACEADTRDIREMGYVNSDPDLTDYTPVVIFQDTLEAMFPWQV